MKHIKENLKSIRMTIPEGVLLVAVTKTRSIEEINEAIQLGVTDIGENKVQEILDILCNPMAGWKARRACLSDDPDRERTVA